MNGTRRRRWTGLLAAAGVLGTMAACGGGASSGILLYNGQHPQLTSTLVAAFTRATGIHVRQRTDDGIVLAGQILQEGDRSPADVYVTENSPELMTLEQHGRLARLDRTILDQVPAADSSPTGRWVGMALRVSALAYDPARLPAPQLPTSILQLAQAQWKGRVAVAPTDSDFPPLVGAVIATYGPSVALDWLTGLKRNADVYQDDEAVVAAVNRGNVASGLINSYYWYRLRLEVGSARMRSAVHYFPDHDVGSVVNIAGAAVLASSQHREAARAFVSFLVSRAGQEVIARSDDLEYPARPGVAPNSALPSLSAISPATPGAAALGDDRAATELIRRVGLV
jgi:iron(III) transport system substrate-binding protein